MIRSIALAAVFGLCVSAASAQDIVPTAKGAAPAPDASAAPPPPPLDAPRMGEAQRDVVKIGPCTPHAAQIAQQAEEDGARIEPDKAVHGEVGAGIGTNGYREVHASVCKPIGDNGVVAISVGKTEYGGRRRH